MTSGVNEERDLEDTLSTALSLVRSMPVHSAARTLVEISDALFNYGRRTMAERMVAEARSCQSAYQIYLVGIPEDRRRHDFDVALARVLARHGEAADAVRIARSLPAASHERDHLLEDLVRIFAFSGCMSAARRIIPCMSSFLRVYALANLANAYALRGRLTKAAAVIHSMRGWQYAAMHRRMTWETVAQWLAYRGDGHSALAAAKAVRGAERRAMLLASMAVCAAAEGLPLLPIPWEGLSVERRRRRTNPLVYLRAADAVTRRLRDRSAALYQIGLAAAKVGAVAVARQALDGVVGAYGQGGVREIQKEIALAEARAGRFIEAKRAARHIRRRKLRAAALAGIAVAEAAAGDEPAARATAGAIELADSRTEALLAIGREAASAGRLEDARRLFREVSRILKAGLDHEETVVSWDERLYEKTAAAQAAIGDFCGAARTALINGKIRLHLGTIFEATAEAFARGRNYDAALLFAKRAGSVSNHAPLLARIELARRAGGWRDPFPLSSG